MALANQQLNPDDKACYGGWRAFVNMSRVIHSDEYKGIVKKYGLMREVSQPHLLNNDFFLSSLLIPTFLCILLSKAILLRWIVILLFNLNCLSITSNDARIYIWQYDRLLNIVFPWCV